MSRILITVLIAGLMSPLTGAAEPDGCSKFTSNVSHELAVMKQAPQPITAATKPGQGAPALQVDKLYELKLADQSGVSFVITPGKPTLPDNAHAGLGHFRTGKAGRYRIAITSGHWIDIVDGGALIKARDFQGARGCERPHKIVEYDLPAGRDLTLQLSGSADESVIVAITAVVDAPSP